MKVAWLFKKYIATEHELKFNTWYTILIEKMNTDGTPKYKIWVDDVCIWIAWETTPEIFQNVDLILGISDDEKCSGYSPVLEMRNVAVSIGSP